MLRQLGLAMLILPAAFPADQPATRQLIEMAARHAPGLDEALRSALGDDKIKKGTALLGESADFIFAFESAAQPELYIDDRAAGPMERAGQTSLWVRTAQLQTGTVHGFYYLVNGARMGGSTD